MGLILSTFNTHNIKANMRGKNLNLELLSGLFSWNTKPCRKPCFTLSKVEVTSPTFTSCVMTKQSRTMQLTLKIHMKHQQQAIIT